MCFPTRVLIFKKLKAIMQFVMWKRSKVGKEIPGAKVASARSRASAEAPPRLPGPGLQAQQAQQAQDTHVTPARPLKVSSLPCV